MNANLPSDVKCVKTAVKENIPDNWRFCLESVASGKATSAVDRVPNYSITGAMLWWNFAAERHTNTQLCSPSGKYFLFTANFANDGEGNSENPRLGVIVQVHWRSRDFFQMYRVMEVTFVYTIEITQNLTVE